MVSGKKSWAVAVGGLLLAGCATVEDIGLISAGQGGSDSADGSGAQADVEVIADSPGPAARRLDRYTVFEQASCNNTAEQAAAFDSAVNQLKQSAAADNANIVRVLGTGRLENRGMCNDGTFQLTGLAYSDTETAEQPADQAANSVTTQTETDTVTARLEELEALRDRGLINDNEYEQLRSRVLDEAF